MKYENKKESHLKCNPQEITSKYQFSTIKETQRFTYFCVGKCSTFISIGFFSFVATAFFYNSKYKRSNLLAECSFFFSCFVSDVEQTLACIVDTLRIIKNWNAFMAHTFLLPLTCCSLSLSLYRWICEWWHTTKLQRKALWLRLGYIVCIHFLCTSIESSTRTFNNDNNKATTIQWIAAAMNTSHNVLWIPAYIVLWFNRIGRSSSCFLHFVYLILVFVFLIHSDNKMYLNDTMKYFYQKYEHKQCTIK